MAEPENQFGIEIDFQKSSAEPSRVFRTMSGLIEAFESLDKGLVVSVDSRIEPLLLLENIEVGSLKAWLQNRIEKIPDDVLKSGDYKKAVGAFLVKAKHVVVDWMRGRTSISNRRELEGLQGRLLQLAEETQVRQLPAYMPPDTLRLIKGINEIASALKPLGPNDRALMLLPDGQIPFNMQFDLVPDQITDLLVSRKLTNESEMILKVKKPDFLGDSQWELKHGTQPILAKIEDTDWLAKFHDRTETIRPGDSIRVKLETVILYDHDNNPLSTRWAVKQVLQIIRPPSAEQGQIPLDSN